MATRRGYFLEELQRAKENLEWSLTHLARIVEAYQEPHPEIANQATEIGNAIVMIADAIQKLHDSI